MSEMVERVADAMAAVNLISRFNDWTSDRMPSYPIEICDISGGDPVVIKRFRAEHGEQQALADVVAIHRARAAITAMREPTKTMVEAGEDALPWDNDDSGGWYVSYNNGDIAKSYTAMIDEALSDSNK